MEKLTKEEEIIFGSARALPEGMAEATDFDANEAIKLDYSVQLPESFSLGKWIYKTSNQGSLGSCFEGNSKILMGDYSYKKIKEIEPDDVVLTYEGLARVVKTYNNGNKPLLELKFNKIRGNKSGIKCTPDHKFFIYEDGEEKTREAKDLFPGDKILIPIQPIEEKDTEVINIEDYLCGDVVESDDGLWVMKLTGKNTSRLPKKIRLTDDLIRLFGFYVAEGNVMYDGGCIHGISLTFHEEETDYIDFCIKTLESAFPGSHVGVNNKKGSKAYTIRVSNALLGELFKNMFNHLCYYKTIPNFIYELPIERFRLFLHTLVEGDGYFTKKGESLRSREIGITITADRVMNMISNKLFFNHIPHSIELRNNSTKDQARADTYGIYLYGDNAAWLMPEIFTSGKSLKEDRDEFVNIGGVEYVAKAIKSIEELDEDVVYNIEVEGNHTYCVNRIKVHNCTSLGTTHSVQILNVKKNGIVPTTKNIITPVRKDLWSKMGHSTTEYDGGDYVEKAVSTALKEGILIEENGELARFDAYATDEWTHDNVAFDKMKRYLYQGCPIVWLVRGDAKMWNEITAGEVKTVPAQTTGAHCIALVGWDKGGMWFINSWRANDERKLKSRFYITYDVIIKLGGKFNYRYRVLYMKENEAKDAEYLKRKNAYLTVLQVLKKYYPIESSDVQKGIEAFSKAVRANYPELNKELPK